MALKFRAAVVVMLLSAVLGTTPAHAALKAHVVAHVSPATALVGSIATVTGTVTPASRTPVVLERYVKKQWKPLATQKPLAGKTFLFHVRASALLVLRVVRGSTVSGTLHVKATRTSYTVTATLAGQVVSGTVKPQAKGSVQVQILVGKLWRPVASATLTAASTYAVTLARPAGSYRLRVVKSFSTTVAAGTGKAFTLLVPAPVAAPAPVLAPVVTTAALAAARVAVAYSAALTATGGTAPLTWSATSLPTGLTVSPAGVVTGTPTASGTAALTVIATDAAGRTGSAALSLTIAPRAGRLYSWGYNGNGQLGSGVATAYTSVLGPVTGMTSVTAVSTGRYDSFAVRSDGALFGWGANSQGELGTGHPSAVVASPVAVSGIDSVTAVANGDASTYALRADGTVWAWGSNNYGQLGNHTVDPGLVPAPVPGLSGVVAIAAGASTGYALKADGTVWGWGFDVQGEIGDGGNTSIDYVVQVANLTSVVSIAAGQDATYAVKSDGTVWAWGNGANGALGNGGVVDSNVPVPVVGLSTGVAVAGGEGGGYALLTNGTVWAWGDNRYGTLGNGVVSGSSTVPVQVHDLTGVLSISAGYSEGYALLADGTAQAWGFRRLRRAR